MSLMSLFQSRANKLPTAYLEHLRPFLPWTLVATGGPGRAPITTFQPNAHGAATAWIAKAQSRKLNVMVCAAELTGPVSGSVLVRGHLRGSRHFGVRLPLSMAAAVEAFNPAPFLRLEAGGTLFLGWRLFNEVPVEAIERVANAVASKLGGVSLGHLFPVAGTLQQHDRARVELIHMFKDRLPMLTDFLTTTQAAPAPAYVRGDTVEARAVSWLWKDKLPRGALSLVAGPGGVGKSTVAASLAATVTVGGVFPDGSAAVRGGVIFLEAEDDTASITLPRLAAAGADLTRVVVGPVSDLSEGVAALNAARKALAGDCSLLVLSPVRSFFGPESFVETTVRAKLAPVLAWAERHGVAVLGVSHPPKGKRELGGAVTWTNAARAGFFVEKSKGDRSRRVMSPLKANSGRDDWEFGYRIVGVKLPDGIETSRVVWESAGESHSPEAALSGGVVAPQANASVGVVRDHLERADNGPSDWLRRSLEHGPRSATELKASAAAAGIPERTLYRAAKRLGTTTESGGYGRARIWKL